MLLLDRALKEEEQESMNDESRGGELPPFISLGDLKTYRDCIYSMADVHQQERKRGPHRYDARREAEHSFRSLYQRMRAEMPRSSRTMHPSSCAWELLASIQESCKGFRR